MPKPLARREAVSKDISALARLPKELGKNRYLYIMLVPVLAYYLLFHYGPMYGLLIAFKNFVPSEGIWDSPWVGARHFIEFFSNVYSWRIIRNVILINFLNILFGFPAPIILALLLNELRGGLFKRIVQTLTYLPHFVSLIIIIGLFMDFMNREGVVNRLLMMLGFESVPFFARPEWFRFLYVSSAIWQTIGWDSIIFLAAIAGISPELYEAAEADGAGRVRKLWHITLPGLLPTIIILLIMRVGQIMSVGFEKIILMYNPLTYETADVISSFVYRRGLLMADFSYATAVGLVNSAINFMLLVAVNRLSRRLSETSLW